MSQNISLLGATYSAVPAVVLPKQGGGSATFTDVTDTTAAAADVASGKYFYTAAGVKTQGTASGGGGGAFGTLLKTQVLGDISTTATNNTDTGITVKVADIDDYNMFLVECSVTTVVNGRHIATVRPFFIYNNGSSGTSPKTTVTMTGGAWILRSNNSGTEYNRAPTSAYGVFPNACTLSDGTATIAIYTRYSNSYSGTINGNYQCKVYGIKLRELVGL